MKNYNTRSIVYEYKYANVSEEMRQQIRRERQPLFIRSSRGYTSIEKSSAKDTALAMGGIITGIILFASVVSYII